MPPTQLLVVLAVVALAGVVVIPARLRAAPPGQRPGGGFHPVGPARLTAAPLTVEAGRWVTVPVTGQAGVPASGVSAVALSVTGAQATAATDLTVAPAPRALTGPNPTNVSVRPGEVQANVATVAPGADGSVAVFNRAGRAQVTVDVLGWYDGPGTDEPGATYKAAEPTGLTPATLAVGPAAWTRVPVAGVGGAPTTGLRAVTVSVTVTRASAATSLSVLPAPLPPGTPPPTTDLTVGAGSTGTHLTTVAPAADGTIAVYNRAGTARVRVDLLGWYDSSTTGATVTPVDPTPLTPKPVTVGPGRWASVAVLGRAGVPARDVSAVTVSVTAVAAIGPARLAVRPSPSPAPDLSTVALPGGGRARANVAVVTPAGDGTIAVYNAGFAAQVRVDVLAYASFTCTSRSLTTVAHQDDDLLFVNPDQQRDLDAGACDQTVYLTAGDANTGWADHARRREQAARTTHALARGVRLERGEDASAHYGLSDAGIPGHPAARFTLSDNPRTTLVFLRLADANLDGSDCYSWDDQGRCTSKPPPPLVRYESLGLLWKGAIPDIHALDRSTSYTRAELIRALAALVSSYDPSVVRTQDYSGQSGVGLTQPIGSDDDHNDHHSVGLFTADAAATAGRSALVVTYKGYPELQIPYLDNLSDSERAAKEAAWQAYLPFDDQGAYDSDRFGQAIARQHRLTPGAPLQPTGSDRCLAAGSPPGSPPIVTACTGGPDQRWTLTTASTLAVGPDADTCLDAAGGLGRPPTLAACSGGASQVWTHTSMGELRTGGDRCLDLTGEALHVESCAGRATQRFSLGGNPSRPAVEIHGLNGKCLFANLPESLTGGPSTVANYRCGSYPDAQWIHDPATGEIRGDWSTKCLTGDGTDISLATCAPGASQRWALRPDGEIELTGTGRCLDMGSPVDSTLTRLSACGTNPAGQRWAIGDFVTTAVQAAGADRCLDVGAGASNGTAAVLAPCSGAAGQRWTHTSEAQELRVLGGKCLDNRNGSQADGSVVQVWDCAGNANQQWLVHDDGTVEWYQGRGRSTGRCLTANDQGAVGLYRCGAYPASQTFRFP